jgi:hypothetical protein
MHKYMNKKYMEVVLRPLSCKPVAIGCYRNLPDQRVRVIEGNYTHQTATHSCEQPLAHVHNISSYMPASISFDME